MPLSVYRQLQVDLSDAKDRFRLFDLVRQPNEEMVKLTREHLKMASELDRSIPARKLLLARAIRDIQQLEEELVLQFHHKPSEARA